MPWLKCGDNAATNPLVMSVYAHADGDPRALNEVFGFVMRCALQSAGHTTDYVIDEGTAFMLGMTETPRLLELAVKAGYLKEHKRKGLRVWKLVDDPEFIHMRLRSEIDWERQQRADNANPALIVPVRLRDGDACRYCGSIVNWRARKGKLAGTYDHRIAGKAATVETLVVACGACNSGRRDNPDADDRYPLRPEPANPFYSSASAAFLTEHGRPVKATPALRSADNLQKPPRKSADSADPVPTESGFAGSGRVREGLGSGLGPAVVDDHRETTA